MSLTEFLTYAAGPGINAIVGFVLSFAVEWYPDFETLDPRWKRLVTMILSFAIPVLATLGLWLISGLPPTEELLAGLWNALQSGFLAFFASQAAHIRTLKPLDILD